MQDLPCIAAALPLYSYSLRGQLARWFRRPRGYNCRLKGKILNDYSQTAPEQMVSFNFLTTMTFFHPLGGLYSAHRCISQLAIIMSGTLAEGTGETAMADHGRFVW